MSFRWFRALLFGALWLVGAFAAHAQGVLPLPDWVPVSTDLAEALKPLHKWAALTLTALVGLHVAAVVKHQLIDRDGLLWRMWPGRRG